MLSFIGVKNVLKSRYISNSLDLFQSFFLRSLSISQGKMAVRRLSGDREKTGLEEYPGKIESVDKCLFKFGVISDVQYGDVDDILNFEGSTMRYHRNALKLLEEAVNFWKKSEPDFVLQLGDLVEGNHVKKQDRKATLQTVLDVCKQLKCYICHIWGNHEFYLFSRKELVNSLLNSKIKLHEGENPTLYANCSNSNEVLTSHRDSSCTSNGTELNSVFIKNISHLYENTENSGRKYFFAFSPHPRFKFIVLDSYDISICGREEADREYDEAKKILSLKNTNKNWNSPFGLTEPRFVKFNGGISAEQLQWLHEELASATNNGQHVIIASHVPIHPESTIFICNIWNYQDLLDVIWSYSCVRACLCGHSHEPGDFKDHNGIQHIVFPAVLECARDENAFADVFVYEDKICIVGYGKVKSYVIDL